MKFSPSLVQCLFAASLHTMAIAEPLIENGEFATKSVKPWKVFSLPDQPATSSKVADGVLTISAAGSTDKPSNRQLVQQVKVESGTKYRLDFDAKASLEKGSEFQLVLVRGKNPSKPHYGLWRKLPLNAEWKTETIYFTTKDIDPSDPPLLKFLLGSMQGEVSFRNIKLIEAKGTAK